MKKRNIIINRAGLKWGHSECTHLNKEVLMGHKGILPCCFWEIGNFRCLYELPVH